MSSSTWSLFSFYYFFFCFLFSGLYPTFSPWIKADKSKIETFFKAWNCLIFYSKEDGKYFWTMKF